MKLSFWDKVFSAARRNGSALVVGLDPVISKLPAGIPRSAEGARTFLTKIISATADLVCAFKPNLAFFLAMGAEGLDVLVDVVRFVPDHIPVILDGKFGDVEHTARQYALFASDVVCADAVTVNPYIGRDTVRPFMEAGLGVFLLCATSNPSYGDIEGLSVSGGTLYEVVAGQTVTWSEEFGTRLGLVVGATHPQVFGSIRRAAPKAPFLVPGVGAQGGRLEEVLGHSATADGFPPMIVSARTVIYASSGEDFAEAARRKASEIKEAINSLGRLFR